MTQFRLSLFAFLTFISGTVLAGNLKVNLLKAFAFASGYQPRAQWEWIYDAQRVKTVDHADVWEITVALDPVP